jgi:dTDP-4-amino-4,6-dideoxygalactose transaminase
VLLSRAAEFRARRKVIADRYLQNLVGSGAELPRLAGHEYYRFIVRTPSPSQPLAAHLQERGVDARTSVNPWLDSFASVTLAGPLPQADRWRTQLLSLPIYPSMTDDAVDAVISAVKEVLR